LAAMLANSRNSLTFAAVFACSKIDFPANERKQSIGNIANAMMRARMVRRSRKLNINLSLVTGATIPVIVENANVSPIGRIGEFSNVSLTKG